MSSLFGIDFPPCSCAMILYAREVRRRQEAVCYMVRPATQNARRMVAKPKKMGHRFYRYPIDFIVVRPAGIEPAAYCLGGRLYWRCHNLLQLLSRYIVVVDTVCDVARRDKDISLWSQNGRKGEYREGQEYGYSEKSHTLHRCAGQRE